MDSHVKSCIFLCLNFETYILKQTLLLDFVFRKCFMNVNIP